MHVNCDDLEYGQMDGGVAFVAILGHHLLPLPGEHGTAEDEFVKRLVRREGRLPSPNPLATRPARHMKDSCKISQHFIKFGWQLEGVLVMD